MKKRNNYTKEFLKEIVDKSNYWSEVFNYLKINGSGGNYVNIKKKIFNFGIDTSHFLTKKEIFKRKKYKTTLKYEDLFIKNCKHARLIVKRFIYQNKLLPIECILCKQGESWYGKKMSLVLDHINGINNDNRIENLRLLCPNCNATLDTHCRGNKNMGEKLTW